MSRKYLQIVQTLTVSHVAWVQIQVLPYISSERYTNFLISLLEEETKHKLTHSYEDLMALTMVGFKWALATESIYVTTIAFTHYN